MLQFTYRNCARRVREVQLKPLCQLSMNNCSTEGALQHFLSIANGVIQSWKFLWTCEPNMLHCMNQGICSSIPNAARNHLLFVQQVTHHRELHHSISFGVHRYGSRYIFFICWSQHERHTGTIFQLCSKRITGPLLIYERYGRQTMLFSKCKYGVVLSSSHVDFFVATYSDKCWWMRMYMNF